MGLLELLLCVNTVLLAVIIFQIRSEKKRSKATVEQPIVHSKSGAAGKYRAIRIIVPPEQGAVFDKMLLASGHKTMSDFVAEAMKYYSAQVQKKA